MSGASLAKGGPKGPAVTEKIAFISRNHLHVMNPDGSGLTELVSSNAVEDDDPMWSKDRSKLVFTSNRVGVSNVWMVNADFTGLTQVTTGIYARFPAFTPNGAGAHRSRSCRICARSASGGTFRPARMPSPPARETSAASPAPATRPIPDCTIG